MALDTNDRDQMDLEKKCKKEKKSREQVEREEV